MRRIDQSYLLLSGQSIALYLQTRDVSSSPIMYQLTRQRQIQFVLCRHAARFCSLATSSPLFVSTLAFASRVGEIGLMAVKSSFLLLLPLFVSDAMDMQWGQQAAGDQEDMCKAHPPSMHALTMIRLVRYLRQEY